MTGEQRGTFTVEHLGCKISQTDAEAVRDALAGAGHDEVSRDDGAPVQVVNTCCITRAAEKSSRQRVRRMLRDAGDEGRVFVTGCGANLHGEQYRSIDPERVTVLAGAAATHAPAIVEAADALADLGCVGPRAGSAPRARSRAFLKVQDGCSFGCTYCIVPTVRGEPRSRTVEAVLAEARRRADAGIAEVVVTGVNVGLYRCPDSRVGLPALLQELAAVDGIERVRISSIESNHVNARLADTIATSGGVICPHLHVPLQSGDDGVLAAMGRHYDADRYRRSIATARERVPELNLTTDVIVGFPAEDEAAFQQTLGLCRELAITKVHAFPFSERPGTPAAELGDPVSKTEKAERSERLRAQADEVALAHRRRLVGTADCVVVETRRAAGYGAGAGVLLTDDHVAADGAGDRDATIRTGYTRDYSPVLLDGLGDDVPDGVVVDVAITGLDAATGVLRAMLR